MTLPLGMVNTRSSACLPTTAAAISTATNRRNRNSTRLMRFRGAQDDAPANVGEGAPHMDVAAVEIDVADAQQPVPPSRPDAAPHEQDQAVTPAPSAPIAVRRSQPPGRNAAHCPDRPLHPQGHPKILSNRFAKPLCRKHLRDPPLRAEPLPTRRPDGKGQARGARGEPPSIHVNRLLTVFCMKARL
jgi:hypothetical protein